MIFNSISMKKPTNSKNIFYMEFYRQYSLFQFTNLLFHEAIAFHRNDINSIDDLESLVSNYFDDDYSHIASIVTFIDEYSPPFDEECMKKFHERFCMSKDSDFNFAKSLLEDFGEKKFDLEKYLNFLLNLQEFLFLYSLFEYTIKSLVGIRKDTRQDTLFTYFNNYLDKKEIKEDFYTSIAKKSCGIISEQKEIEKIWKFFTVLRNLYSHASGKLTKKIKASICGNKPYFDNFVKEKLMEWGGKDFNPFDFSLFKADKVYVMSDIQLNFFRNMLVYCMECIDEITKEEISHTDSHESMGKTIKCSFCNKSEDEVEKIMRGNHGSHICNGCISSYFRQLST